MSRYPLLTRTLNLFMTIVLLSPVFSAAGEAPSRPAVSVRDKDVLVTSLNRPVFTYQYKDVPCKPYVKALYSPAGRNVLRDAPHDHLHHHGLMFAIMVDGVNFWEEHGNAGWQIPKALTKVQSAGAAGLTESLQWRFPKKKALMMLEKREVKAVFRKELAPTFLIWKSTLSVPPGKKVMTLTGNHYHGLGMRFPVSMDKGGEFRNAADAPGKIFRGQERLIKAAWCAYTAKVDGKTVTVAMFGHPDNARGLTQWFAMTGHFAYLSATLNWHAEPLKVVEGKPLVLCYAVAVWDGRPAKADINKLVNRWTAWCD